LFGASIVVVIENFFSGGELGSYIHIIMGVIFVACVLLFRNGIVGEFNKFVKKNF
jgi:branched-chain amino acid transport system permease protein